MTETPNPHIVDTDTLTGDLRPIRTAVLALGSNLGDRFAALQGAVEALADTPDVKVVAVSSVYETKPIDAPDGSKSFLNAVLIVDTTLSTATLLERALAVEAAFGRERSAPNAPRTLDVDLIAVGNRVVDDDDGNNGLTLPHPRAAERAFVLIPWHEIDGQAQVPGHGYVADLIRDLDTDGVVRRPDLMLDFAS
jgi:2-amino-4-hydroxy-6-hydroxymethyldihydropteridine diphosphokinase